jgi:energy-converting hydrogenase Eha subunit A
MFMQMFIFHYLRLYSPTGYDPEALNAVWRSFYLIGFIFTAMVLVYRGLVLEEDKGHEKLLARKQRRDEKLSQQGLPTWKILSFYSPRLVGTGGSWFVWNVAFYGLKLFSGPIFVAINPGGDLIVQNGYLLVNNICALVGYYCTAYVIDWPSIGRKKLQIFSFMMSAIIFTTIGAIFNSAGPEVLMALFFTSSFFGQFGANVTTYVMAAETYPTELRGTCHGW